MSTDGDKITKMQKDIEDLQEWRKEAKEVIGEHGKEIVDIKLQDVEQREVVKVLKNTIEAFNKAKEREKESKVTNWIAPVVTGLMIGLILTLVEVLVK